MAAEPILIVDDTPVNLKLTRILLVNEGYQVRTAASAEEALDLLRSYHPELILADIQLPGMDGLEMTRRLKLDPRTRDITVVALTAFAMKGDEQKAVEAGCDGYITKPIDTRTLGERVREYLDARAGTRRGGAPPASEADALAGEEMQELRRRFLEEGQECARRILAEMDGPFDPVGAARFVHQWIGAGGLLGYTAISRLAREVEALMRERPVDSGQLRESLTNLATAFSSQRESRHEPVPEEILRALSGKIVAMVGLPSHESERLCLALEGAHARPVFFELAALPKPDALEGCDVVVTYVHPESAGSPWLDPASAAASRPTVFVGHRDHLLALDPRAQAMAREFLMDSWQPDEALMRLSLALSRTAHGSIPAGAAATAGGSIRALVADSDDTVTAALAGFGVECIPAAGGREAIELARERRPEVVVLDVSMPGMDEVLAAIRRENIPTRVLILTSRQQESEILRGFALGADDYMVKPIHPLELAARIKRLLTR